ncbi:MAG: hypothetical protein KIS87_01955 [Phycisphaeraceae bacterium]|nr:hypothetical protein [Phycisphaeraceae bacterium]
MSESHPDRGADAMERALASFREAARLGPGVEVRPERAIALAAVLTRIALGLDQIAWGTWKKIAPRSQVRRVGSLSEAMATYCAGRGDNAEADLERLRLLISAMLTSVSQVGHFAHRELGRLSPEMVEDGVTARGVGRDGACWRRYRELAGDYDEDLLEASMLSAMSEYVEAMLEGGVRRPAAPGGAEA